MAPPPLFSPPTCGLAGAIHADWTPYVIHRAQVTRPVSFSLTGLADMHVSPVGPTTSRCLGRPESPSRHLFSNLGEAVQTHSVLSWMQDCGRCGPHLSKHSGHSRFSSLQQHGKSVPEATKIRSRISNFHQVRSIKSCFVGPNCSEHWVHAEIPIQPRNSEPGSTGQRRTAGAVGRPGFSEELRRFLAFNYSVSGLEERIRSLEKENVELLLEIWSLKLQFARVKRELRCELFRLKMKRIFDEFDSNLCHKFNGLSEEEIVFRITKEWMLQKLKELQFSVVPLWGKISRILDVFGSIGLVIASFKFIKFLADISI